jgi:hypothetical protein
MAAIVEAAKGGDWRDDCVQPAKDSRVKTEVLSFIQIISLLY